MIRNFYGVYLRDNQLGAALNLIRYLGQPDWVRFTHITLRGPYPNKLSKSWLDSRINDPSYKWEIRLEGPGQFTDPGQNTVLIAVDLLNLGDLFYKKDFRKGVPHLTLYDGKDAIFAKNLLQLLLRYDLHKIMPVTELMLLERKLPPMKVFQRLDSMLNEVCNKYIGYPISSQSVFEMGFTKKLSIIEGILDDNFSRWSENLQKARTIDVNENLSFDFFQ